MIVPEIEKQTLAFSIVCYSILSGAADIIISLSKTGLPVYPPFIFILIEIIAPILLIYWQRQIAVNEQKQVSISVITGNNLPAA
jgi:hypothetical protein